MLLVLGIRDMAAAKMEVVRGCHVGGYWSHVIGWLQSRDLF